MSDTADRLTKVTGTVTKLDRSALPPATRVSVELQDVSRADAPAVVLGEHVVTTGGEQVPIPFAIGYAPDAIEPGHRYVVRATIRIDGDLAYSSADTHSVLTGGAPTFGVEILVRPTS